MRKWLDSSTSSPVGREEKGDGARAALPVVGLVGAGGIGQSCFVIACILEFRIRLARTIDSSRESNTRGTSQRA
jgi:phosphoglycerate dehydrogenase-like enzyme